jgi:hypothetical protein
VKTDRSELAVNRHAFWTAFVDRIPGERELGGPAQYTPNRWRVLPDLKLIISMYLAKGKVGLFIRGPHRSSHEDTKELFRQNEAELTRQLGVPMGNSDWAFFASELVGDYNDPAQRDSLIDWLDRTASHCEQVAVAVFGQ